MNMDFLLHHMNINQPVSMGNLEEFVEFNISSFLNKANSFKNTWHGHVGWEDKWQELKERMNKLWKLKLFKFCLILMRTGCQWQVRPTSLLSKKGVRPPASSFQKWDIFLISSWNGQERHWQICQRVYTRVHFHARELLSFGPFPYA